MKIIKLIFLINIVFNIFCQDRIISDCQPENNDFCGVRGQNCTDRGLICCVDNVRSRFAMDGCPKVYGCMSENMCNNETISSKFFIWPFFR